MLYVLALALIVVVFVMGYRAYDKYHNYDNDEESIAAIKAAVERAALQCYVVEGVYPPDLQYLRDNYGLQINTDDYYVVYDIYASNQPPTVKVVVR